MLKSDAVVGAQPGNGVGNCLKIVDQFDPLELEALRQCGPAQMPADIAHARLISLQSSGYRDAGLDRLFALQFCKPSLENLLKTRVVPVLILAN